jgi:hypothetical protein
MGKSWEDKMRSLSAFHPGEAQVEVGLAIYAELVKINTKLSERVTS